MDKLTIGLPGASSPRRRLFSESDILPWVAAQQELEGCRLFWMPLSGFPPRHEEKVWLTEFLERFGDRLGIEHGLRTEIFLQYKQITPEMGDSFRRYAQQCMKLLGIGRFANNDLPSFPSQEQVKKAVESGQPFDFRDWLGDYLIWFVSKQPKQQRELFLGSGGMTTIYLPPDPKLKPLKLPFTPALRAALPVFKRVDVDGIVSGTLSMQDVFLEKSKQLFGAGLEDKPEYPGIAFVLPLLDSNHFFLADADLRERWFNLFDVYVNESRKDGGIILAFRKEEYDEVLGEVLQSMREDGFVYKVER